MIKEILIHNLLILIMLYNNKLKIEEMNMKIFKKNSLIKMKRQIKIVQYNFFKYNKLININILVFNKVHLIKQIFIIL